MNDALGKMIAAYPRGARAVASRSDEAALLAEVAVTRGNEALLDLWCGNGELAELLADRVGTVVAVDYSHKLIDQAQTRYPDVTFRISHPVKLDFADASFDIVTVSNSIHHNADPEGSLAEAFRVLRPHGRIVVTMPIHAHRVGWQIAWQTVERHVGAINHVSFGGPLFKSAEPQDIVGVLAASGFFRCDGFVYETVSEVRSIEPIVDLILNKSGRAETPGDTRADICEAARSMSRRYFREEHQSWFFPGRSIAAVGWKAC